MDVPLTTCPQCGGAATLLQIRDEVEEIPDLSRPGEMTHVAVKIEEFRCDEVSCEYKFEKIVRRE